MKYLFVILVGTGTILQSFSKLIILTDFELNKDFIAKNLCVQRAVKNNHCNGHCHLKKQLQKDEKNEQAPNSLKSVKEIQIICQNYMKLQFHSDPVVVRNCTPYLKAILPSHPLSVFHPPQF